MTATNGEQILSSLIETRKFLEQVALLVRTADDQIENAGWEVISSNKCADLSGHVHRPQRWMPSEIYRFRERKAADGFHFWEWVRGHLDEGYEPDGEFHPRTFTIKESKQYDGLARQTTMALPLVAIASAEDVEHRLVQPLLREVANSRG